MNKLQQAWQELNPNMKRNVALGSAVGVVLLIAWAFVSASSDGAPRASRGRDKTIESVLTDSDPRQAGFDAMVTNIKNLERKNTELERKMRNIEGDSGPSGEKEKQIAEMKASLDDLSKQMKDQAEKAEKAQRDLEEAKKKGDSEKPAEGQNQISTGNKAPTFQPATAKHSSDSAAGAYFQSAPVAPVNDGEKKERDKGAKEVKIRTITQAEEASEKKSEKEEDEIYIPAGSIINGALITGVDAPTGNAARKDPFPVLLRIKREAILPNRFRADIRECFIIASGFGDLSSERAYIRGESISCVREDGGVIESTFDAFASGEDGKAGVRGRLVSKQGQLLARSMMAGFLDGVAQAFTPQKVPSLTIRGNGSSGSDTDPVYEQALNESSLQGAAFGGVGKAMERVADFYLEMAEGMFPVIEVDAGREIDFIIKKGTKLKIKSAKPVS